MKDLMNLPVSPKDLAPTDWRQEAFRPKPRHGRTPKPRPPKQICPTCGRTFRRKGLTCARCFQAHHRKYTYCQKGCGRKLYKGESTCPHCK